MIVFNFPDRCPSCASTEIIPAMVESDKDVPEGQQPFLCKNCNVMWSEKLITTKDWTCMVAILEAAWMLPKGILVDHRIADPAKAARKLLGLPEGANHIVVTLQKVLDDGNEQTALTKKGAKKLWIPPPRG